MLVFGKQFVRISSRLIDNTFEVIRVFFFGFSVQLRVVLCTNNASELLTVTISCESLPSAFVVVELLHLKQSQRST